jgi:homotetrameric cytidine deaminase
VKPLPPEAAEALLEAACQAASQAYAPYSGFAVGAAILLENGSIVSGFNIENASLPLGLCAERVAVAKALSLLKENQPGAWKAIAIWASETAHHSVTPCGACRQVLAEFFPPQAPVILYHPSTGAVVQLPLQTLLPYTFKR